ncbi:MAG: hypothetical protein A2516_08505 [Alphaproteobacteria bacterium RIFOXYD12_FULL_60_8]|nr:MAG: hypothetical protein A2516_08505 [Alphaproteobacteria bacterium RIFOXYD12_FULL_60_8]
MKARDGDTQVKKDTGGNLRGADGRPAGKAGICPACKTEVPLKAGFRLSSLKCPKCGRLMGKQ